MPFIVVVLREALHFGSPLIHQYDVNSDWWFRLNFKGGAVGDAEEEREVNIDEYFRDQAPNVAPYLLSAKYHLHILETQQMLLPISIFCSTI